MTETRLAKPWRAAVPVSALLWLAVLSLPAWAQRAPMPKMSDDEAKMQLADGTELETRIDGDFDGDGDADTVFVGRGDDTRVLVAMHAYRDEFDLGHEPVGKLQLDAYPKGAATLSIRKGVLVIEDLTGGTTATQSTYRYRYDAKAKRMRLVGLDAERYSATGSHGTVKLSWNLLNGDRVVERGEVNTSGKDDAAIVYAPPVRDKRPSKPLYMEDTPSPDDLIDAL
jgi:hypothetical protein